MPFLIVAIVLAVVCAVLLAYFRSPSVRGRRGEKRVRRILGETKEGVQYVFNDYKILEGNHLSQIDHILINASGIFVIETKNYSGRIYGTDEQQEWTQVLAGGKVKNKIYNPVRQNYTHVYRLQKVLPPGLPVFSLVVLVQNNTQYLHSQFAVPLSSLSAAVHPGGGYKIGPEQMLQAAAALQKAQAVGLTTKEHVRNIQRMQAEIANNICPRCGGKLVLRQSKRGPFYGCENYPKCKFLKKIE